MQNDSSFFVESYLVLHDNKLLDIGSGTPESVEFDFEVIWSKIKQLKQENKFDPQSLKFFHTHHENIGTAYSATDAVCMKSLNIALGVPIYFYIFCLGKDTFDIARYDCHDGTITTNKDINLNMKLLDFLQILSYSGVRYIF
jgi:hypothetical protein